LTQHSRLIWLCEFWIAERNCDPNGLQPTNAPFHGTLFMRQRGGHVMRCQNCAMSNAGSQRARTSRLHFQFEKNVAGNMPRSNGAINAILASEINCWRDCEATNPNICHSKSLIRIPFTVSAQKSISLPGNSSVGVDFGKRRQIDTVLSSPNDPLTGGLEGRSRGTRILQNRMCGPSSSESHVTKE
jgi:hypothetical protein